MKRHLSRLLSVLLALALLLSALPAVTLAADTTHGSIRVSASGGRTTVTVTPDSGYDLCTLRYTSGGQDTYVDCSSWSKTASGYTITLPVSVSADKVHATFFCTTVWDGSLDVSWYSSSGTTFYLSNPAQLAGLAAIVNGIYNNEITRDMIKGNPDCIVNNYEPGTEGESNFGLNLTTPGYRYGADDFNGKTVYLTCDMDMGGVYDSAAGTWSGAHNYMPIGGQYRMDIEDGDTKIGASFCGTFDGQGYTVANIYCNRRNTDKYYGDGASVGLIGRLGVHDAEDISKRPYDPTVRNVVVTGYIYARRSIGGIVGKTGKTAHNNSGAPGTGSIIENCANYATIVGTDSKGTAGICGSAWNGGVIRNCYNAGSVTSSYGGPCGGIAGYNENSIINCYNVGRVTNTASANYACSIGSDNGGSYVLQNNYYLNDTAAGGGYYNIPLASAGSCTGMTSSAMKTAEFAALLNGSDGRAFVYDKNGVNNGYPVLRVTLHGNEETVTGFTVASEPKLSYLVGDAIDLSAFALYANYSDGTRERVLSYTVTAGDKQAVYANGKTDTPITLRADQLTDGKLAMQVTGSYNGKSFSYSYTLSVDTGITPNSLSVTGMRVRTYVAGERPDTGDVTATVGYTSNSTGATGSQQVEDFTVHADRENADGTLQAGATTLTFSYTLAGQTVSTGVAIQVLAAAPSQADGFYQLSSADDLVWFAAQVNERQQNRISARLTANIDMSQRAHTPIGATSKTCYAGTFDGNGHTITLGSFQTAEFAAMTSNIGLFGYTKNATIANLTVAGSISGGARVCAFIAQDTGYTTVTNCTNAAAINANGYGAGITASVTGPESTYTECVNSGAVTCKSVSSFAAGGIIGAMTGKGAVSLVKCRNTAPVTANTGAAGGVVGDLRGASDVSGCKNTGAVKGTDKVGGIVGTVGDVNTSAIQNCENRGTVTASGTGVGGIVGSGMGYATFSVSACSNHAAVQGGANVGGIAGQIAPLIYNSYNRGTVEATNAGSSTGAGGIVGNANRSSYVWFCYNAGTVKSNANAGALLGYAGTMVTFDHVCYQNGTADKAANAANSNYIKTAPTSAVTAAYLQSGEAVTFLNNDGNSRYFSADVEKTNNGYPVLRATLSSADATVTATVVTSKPTKLSYVEGQRFSATGLVLSAVYSDGTKERITEYTVEPYRELTLADNNKKVTVSGTYQGFTFRHEFTITVVPASVSLIKVTNPPAQVVYAAGSYFDPTGMEVVAEYTNGKTVNIPLDELLWEPSGALQASDQWVTLSYTCPTGTFRATVSIQVQAAPELTQDSAGYYQISTTSDLLLFMSMVNERGMTDIKGKLLQNIDATTSSFKPIGSEEAPFTGALLGGGHTVTVKLPGSTGSRALFGALGRGAVVQELTIAGSVSGRENLGALAATATGATISGCKSTASVSGTQNVAGLVGYAVDCSFTGCENAGTLDAKGSAIGGIAGLASGCTFTDCKNTAPISASGISSVGGIAAISYGCGFTGCTNSANINSGANGGGIVGDAEYGQSTFTNCRNTGAVSGSGLSAGGIVGDVGSEGSATATFTDCVNSGAVTAQRNAGGIAGSTVTSDSAPTGFTRCGNTASVTAQDIYAGGIVGSGQGSLSACFNTGDITAQRDVGGLVGTTTHLSVTESYATGTVRAQSSAPGEGSALGGLIGLVNGPVSISTSYSGNTLQAAGTINTGLVGYAYGNVQLENTYTTAPATCGGVFGDVTVTGEVASAEGLTAMQLGLNFMPVSGALPQLCWQNGHTHSFTGSISGSDIVETCACGYTVTQRSDCQHQWVAGARVAPTCTKPGSQSYSCSLCGMTFSEELAVIPCPSAQFADVKPAGNWAHSGIDFCVEQGLMNGMSAGRFDPDGTLTRAQLVTILYRVAGQPDVTTSGTFSDLTANWYKRAVEWAAANGIVNGYPDGTFRPDDPITREQIAAILYRNSGSHRVDTDQLSGFPDAGSVSRWAKDGLNWAVNEGLINGVKVQGTSYLQPQATATRAQIATIIMRYQSAG